VRGVLYPVGIGPWGSTPDDTYHNQVSDATFAAIPFIWHYEFTRDRELLQARTYPLLKEIASFWEDYLQKDTRGRYVVDAGSYEGTQDINPSQDLGLIRQLFRALFTMSTDLGIDADSHPRWREILEHLSTPPTTTFQQTTVYNHAETGTFPVGKTTINLEFIHPAECLGLGSDPAALRIAHDTIRHMDAWMQSNNAPKIYLQAMRVGYPLEETIRQFTSLLAARFRNNLTLEQTGGGIETSGAIEAIHSMLLQSHEGFIRVFPVWFADRPAQFSRLRAKGAFIVSSEYQDGGVVNVEVFSEQGLPCRVVNPWPHQGCAVWEVTDGEDMPVQCTQDGELVTFETRRGKQYCLKRREVHS